MTELSIIQPSMSQPGCMELLCERNQCLVEEEALRELEAGRDIYTWRPANYSQFWARSLKDGISKKLGAIRPDYPVTSSQQVKDDSSLSYHNTVGWSRLSIELMA